MDWKQNYDEISPHFISWNRVFANKVENMQRSDLNKTEEGRMKWTSVCIFAVIERLWKLFFAGAKQAQLQRLDFSIEIRWPDGRTLLRSVENCMAKKKRALKMLLLGCKTYANY